MGRMLCILAALLLSGCADGCGGLGGGCCKMCDQGQACGDTCIAAGASCTKGSGCACNAPADGGLLLD
jgi:hypothetical protein